jgi:hypothetical protein
LAITLPGTGGEPSLVRVVHCQALGRGGNVDTFSFVGKADVIKAMVKGNLAGLGDAAEKEGG